MHTFIACSIAFAVSLSLAPPPPPPLGWEETITEGFDPPIEEVLVDQFYAEEAERNAHIEAWGEEAVPVLQRLYADERWEEYQDVIRGYLNRYGAPATLEPADERLREALGEIEQGASRVGDDGLMAFQDAVRQDPAGAADIVLDAYSRAEAEAQAVIFRSFGWIAGPEGDRLLQHMHDAAKSDEVRESVTQRIRAREASARVDEPIAVILERERGEAVQ